MTPEQIEGNKQCTECKNMFPTDQLTKCYLLEDDYAGDGSELLCDECIKDSGYCRHCGQFCAGIESFEFGPMAGFCDNCADQIRDSCRDEYDEYDEFADDY